MSKEDQSFHVPLKCQEQNDYMNKDTLFNASDSELSGIVYSVKSKGIQLRLAVKKKETKITVIVSTTGRPCLARVA